MNSQRGGGPPGFPGGPGGKRGGHAGGRKWYEWVVVAGFVIYVLVQFGQ